MERAPDRVAVVVVHGIADQRAGQTVRAVAHLLCRGDDAGPRYVQGEVSGVLVPVARLEPGGAASSPPPRPPSGFYRAQRLEAAAPDLGLALNDYLLGRHRLSDRDALYETTRVSLRRRADDRPVDLFELYWADLSRLREGGWRAVTALYQLFFHLGTLAADVVDQAALDAGGSARWRLLRWLHRGLAWLMTGPAALLQLAMLLLVLFGAAGLVPPDRDGQLLGAVGAAGTVVLLGLAALAWLRTPAPAARWAKTLAALAGALVCVVAVAVVARSETDLPVLHFGASAVAVAVLGAWLIERYARLARGVRVLGHLLVAATVIAVCAAGRVLLPQSSTQAEWMVTATLNVAEWLLAAMLLVGLGFVAVLVVALTLGAAVSPGPDGAGRRSVHTARLGVVGSSALFAVLSLVLWSVIADVAGRALTDLFYLPVLFPGTYRSGEIFLGDRIQELGRIFTPLMAAFLVVGAAILLVLVPSLREELRPTTNADARGPRPGAAAWAARLGGWLDGGLRSLGWTLRVAVAPAAIVGGLLYAGLVYRQLAFSLGTPGASARWLAGWLDQIQGDTLVSAGKWLAGGALTIAALGTRFTRTFGPLRVGLDAVLDVDNYFADPPDRQAPRARIYARYASLLAYLRDRGYARIVIVSHSQGTVISADLLRYLHAHGRLRDTVGGAPIALVTVGSPLRTLYAERFPLLYRWMGSGAAGFADAGPAAWEIGAVEWVNAFRSGDYVGRAIWSRRPDAYGVAAMGPDGRVAAARAGDRAELCLGAGGHTHYFGGDALALAAEIDRLIGPGAAERSAGR
jgi:hypothetical protein